MNKHQTKSAILLITYAVLLASAMFEVRFILGAIKTFLSILIPLFIGIALVLILVRPYTKIREHFEKRMGKRKKYAKALAILTTYVGLFSIIIVIISFIVPSLTESMQLFGSNLDSYAEKAQEGIAKITQFFNLDQIKSFDFSEILTNILNGAGNILQYLSPGIFNFTQGVVRGLVNILLGLILSIYILADRENLSAGLKRILFAYSPKKSAEKIWRVLEMSSNTFSNFISGQVTDSAILGVLCFIGMSLLGLGYPLLISTIIAVTSLIPVVGAVIGCIPASFILFLVQPRQVLYFLVFFIVLQQFDNNVVYPKVVGTSIGLPAIWVLLSIIVGGGLFGPIGMLLGVPAASVIYHIFAADIEARSTPPTVSEDHGSV